MGYLAKSCVKSEIYTRGHSHWRKSELLALGLWVGTWLLGRTERGTVRGMGLPFPKGPSQMAEECLGRGRWVG